MSKPDHAGRLLARLDAIAHSLAGRDDTLALVALGSVGQPSQHARLDAFSDLDFFAIVQPASKARYIERLDWLAAAHPIAWHFRNTADGHKALMADGVFCEFAVFEPGELAAIPFAPGRVVWRRDGVDAAIATPRQPLPRRNSDETWIVGEALSCLLVGLGRFRRGEKLSALRFVQSHALDRLIELDALRSPVPVDDAFGSDRRLEVRQPKLAQELPELTPGYEGTPRAALALLDALARRGAALDPAVVAHIRALAEPA